eukprot:TRINITY_DN9686_c0_g2_i1.p1 TRINITY_DN9686_c0_g2~~TRINITY_DN9686_c0_g2_i1.p1  ORF type:complete len:382 (+),score=33.58 TRINITY_DN9686_c0_g2_i1:58-1203(+)
MAGLLLFWRDEQGSVHALELSPDASVRDLKEAIEASGGPPVRKQRLACGRAELRGDDTLLADSGLSQESLVGVRCVHRRPHQIARAGGGRDTFAMILTDGRTVRSYAGMVSRVGQEVCHAVGVGGYDAAILATAPGSFVVEGEFLEHELRKAPAFDAGKTVAEISGGTCHVLALFEDGEIAAWGKQKHGRCSVPDFGGAKPVSVCAGLRCSLACLDDGRIVGWGQNHSDVTKPRDFGSRAVRLAIADTQHEAAAVLEDGTAAIWGSCGDLRVTCEELGLAGRIVDVQMTTHLDSATFLCDDGTIVWKDRHWPFSRRVPGLTALVGTREKDTTGTGSSLRCVCGVMDDGRVCWVPPDARDVIFVDRGLPAEAFTVGTPLWRW